MLETSCETHPPLPWYYTSENLGHVRDTPGTQDRPKTQHGLLAWEAQNHTQLLRLPCGALEMISLPRTESGRINLILNRKIISVFTKRLIVYHF